VVLVMVIAAGASVIMFKLIKTELSPLEDRGVIFGFVSAPEGSTVGYTQRYVTQIEKLFEAVPERGPINGNGGWPTATDAMVVLRLTPWNERARSQMDVAKELMPKFMGLAGVSAFAVNPPSLGQSARSKPVEFVIMAQVPYETLQQYVGRMQDEMRKRPDWFTNIDSDLRLNTPELRVQVNRDKVLDVGANVEVVGRTLETMLGGRLVTRFKRDGDQFNVIVQTRSEDRASPDRIGEIYVRGKSGEMIQLSNLLTVREGVSPRQLNHFQRLRSATVNANLVPGAPMREVIAYMNDAAKRVLPPDVQNDLAPSQSREFRDSANDIYFVFGLALGFIYLVLAAQFESFRDPFVILLSVPLSMAGALAALMLTNNSLNIYSQIGLITLVGLITKHGILIVEFSNQLRDQGMAMKEAVIEAATLRLRPILMTTGAMVLGALPLALAKGAGAESRSVIGWVIVGGLLVGTLLTLFVVPTAYTFVSARHRGTRRKQLDKIERDLAAGQPPHAHAGD
jgi:multidrug efflux pump